MLTKEVRVPKVASLQTMIENGVLPTVESVGEGLRTCYLLVVVDGSGSMAPHMPAVRKTIVQLLKELSKANRDSVSIAYKVRMLFFNTEIKMVPKDAFLDPNALLEVLSDSHFTAAGGTHIGKLFHALDDLLSGHKQGGLMAGVKKGDPLPVLLVISDLLETDTNEMDEAAKELFDNLYFENTQRLVVFLGPDEKKAAAEKLAGDEDHLLTLDGGITAGLLAPVTVGTALLMGLNDGTHGSLTAKKEETPREIAESQQKKVLEGAEDREQLADEELRNQLIALLGG